MHSILLVDDDTRFLELIGMTLESHGYRILRATSGRDALRLMQEDVPDLVISDISMPNGDGHDFLQKIRSDESIADTQVVLITGNVQNATLRSELDLGADDFLSKPFRIETLLKCVETRLERAAQRERTEKRMLRQLRSTVTSNLPHELFTPLAGMIGIVQALTGEHAKMPPGEVDELLREVENAGWRLHRTLDNYLTLLRFELEEGSLGEELPLSPEELGLIVRRRVELVLGRHARRADLSLSIESCTLRTTPEAFGKVLEEVFDNACRYSDPGTPLRIALSADGNLEISDEGRGMGPKQLARISAFNQFDRARYEQQGMGLGLTLAQKLLARDGGQLDLASKTGGGTTALIRFPLVPSETMVPNFRILD